MDNTSTFYKNLPKHNLPLTDLLVEEKYFAGVPKDWFVVITDIENSSIAVQEGKHDDVNLYAVGSIITVLNTVKEQKIDLRIPYFFGGDGATFIVPENLLDVVLKSLKTFTQHVKKMSGLVLRQGHIAVEKIYLQNHTLRIAKLQHNDYLVTPIVLGLGLKIAEKQIKDSFMSLETITYLNSDLALDGMECRWDEILPDNSSKKVFCLLVSCNDETKQAQIFKDILRELEFVFGNLDQRNPITLKKLKLNNSLAKIRQEMYARLGKYNFGYLVKNYLITLLGHTYFKYFKDGREYAYSLTRLTDTLMMDGSINTVISGYQADISRFKIYLDQLEQENKITFGIHITHASIMSCYVEDRDRNHIHFVDGTEGGYTTASVMYKKKMKKNNIITF